MMMKKLIHKILDRLTLKNVKIYCRCNTRDMITHDIVSTIVLSKSTRLKRFPRKSDLNNIVSSIDVEDGHEIHKVIFNIELEYKL